MPRKLLVTAALPYANGPLHIGHLAGCYLPADIYVRFQRMRGNDVLFICGTDEHGVPITISAERDGISPKQLVDKYHKHIKETFSRLFINFDNFSGTSRSVHYKISSEFFLKLYEKNLLVKKNINQLYCPKEKKFLPDRYVEGTCPKCNASGARGDQCEACGSQLDPTELIRPYCKICNTTPILKETFHWFLKLAEFQKKLEQWQGNHKDWKDNVYNYCQGWFKEGLGDRPITRDIEWGVPVPLEEAKGKVIYVWFEAPIGYISSTIEWAEKKGEPELWKSYWKNPDCELIHFIGKDNIVFHAITWPATLMAQDGFILPRHIPANEFLNIEGQKLSTSRNRAVWVHEYLENFPSDSLRYYLATIAPEAKDADFSWSEFMLKHNSELADIYGNFVNRNFTFAHRYFGSSVPPLRNPSQTDYSMLNAMEKASKEMADYLDRFQLRLAAKVLMDVARDGNKYFNDKEPWKTRQTDIADCGNTIHVCLQVIKSLCILSYPFIPQTAWVVWSGLNQKNGLDQQGWSDSYNSPLEAGRRLNKMEILFKKIERNQIEKEIEKLCQKTS